MPTEAYEQTGMGARTSGGFEVEDAGPRGRDSEGRAGGGAGLGAAALPALGLWWSCTSRGWLWSCVHEPGVILYDPL